MDVGVFGVFGAAVHKRVELVYSDATEAVMIHNLKMEATIAAVLMSR